MLCFFLNMMPSLLRVTHNFHHIHSRTFHEISHHRSFRLNDLNNVGKDQAYTLKASHDKMLSSDEVNSLTGASVSSPYDEILANVDISLKTYFLIHICIFGVIITAGVSNID